MTDNGELHVVFGTGAVGMSVMDELIRRGRRRVRMVNRIPHFAFLHRARQWNPREQVWMGWERKRGKIEEFNRLLRGATDTSFTVAGRRRSTCCPSVRYCITLDSDTRLPRDAAQDADRHHRASAEPAARSTRALGRVTEGYGILQPRVSVTHGERRRLAVRARSTPATPASIPYTTAVSDIYQDLFGEGIFTGKGLYDVDAFTAALEGRVPENALLSHDLFEGLYARTALVTDVEVVDDYPVERARARAAPAPLGARRLADPVVAVPVRADARRPRAQPPAAHLALEDPRQPAAQPGGAGDAWRCSLAGLDRPAGPAAARGRAVALAAIAVPAVSRAARGRCAGRDAAQPWRVVPARDRRGSAAPTLARVGAAARRSSPTRPTRWLHADRRDAGAPRRHRAGGCSSGRRRRPAPRAARPPRRRGAFVRGDGSRARRSPLAALLVVAVVRPAALPVAAADPRCCGLSAPLHRVRC